MDPHTYGHFNRVARAMNNYVAASAHNYYWGNDADPRGFYQRQAHINSYYSYPTAELPSSSLQTVILNFAYHLRQWIG
ncbi:unnamed protein product [Rotaria sp. Silwood2]|nr:unnamed protein product [Rotaria sp. Silwood2]CAF4041423.1 unnamed protein product [Rotaria sp. Silwood2]